MVSVGDCYGGQYVLSLGVINFESVGTLITQNFQDPWWLAHSRASTTLFVAVDAS